MEATLVLHVSKADQDYDTVIGRNLLRTLNKDMILVMTHVDQLNTKDEKTAEDFVSSIIKSTKEPRFAVLGNHEGDFKDEDAILGQFSCIVEHSEEIKRGTSALNL